MSRFYCSNNYPIETENPSVNDLKIFVISNGTSCLTYKDGQIGDLDSIIWNPKKDIIEFILRNLQKESPLYSNYRVIDINTTTNIKLYNSNFYNEN